MRRNWVHQLTEVVLIGFEDDEDKDKSEEEEGEDGDSGKSDSDNAGLLNALRKERQSNKDMARQLKELAKYRQEQEDRDKSVAEVSAKKAADAEALAARLADRLKRTAIDNAIITEAGKLKFRDIDDAVQLIDRDLVEVDSDDETSGSIKVDKGSVKKALEALAKAKPHLLVAEGQETSSGSKFAGGRKSQKDADDEALRAKYSALNRSGITN